MIVRKPMILIVIAALSLSANANDPLQIDEKASLESVIKELGYLQGFVTSSRERQKLNDKSRFNYVALEHRLEVLKYDINRYLIDSDPLNRRGD